MYSYKWRVGSRWYTSDLHVATIDIWTFIAPWHEGFYHGVEEIAVIYISVARRWQIVSYQRLLQIACQAGASLRIRIARYHWTPYCPPTWRRYDWEVMGHPVYSPNPVPSHFLAFEPLKKDLAVKRFANRRRREASCYLLDADTWHRFLLRRDTSLVYHFGCNSSIRTVNTRRSDAYHLLNMCHIYIRVTSRHQCLLNYILNTFIYTYVHNYWIAVCVFFTYIPCILILSKFFIHHLMHKWIVLNLVLKFTLKLTLKHLLHVSVQSPSSGALPMMVIEPKHVWDVLMSILM
jgi:hypothetical protein